MNPIDVTEVKNALAGMAEILWTYYQELRGQGFSRKEAFQLVRDYHNEIHHG